MRAKILFSILGSMLLASIVQAQYYYDNGYYNYSYGNNPNNGVVTFQPGYNSYDSSYQNYNYGYNTNYGYTNCSSGYAWNGYSCVGNSNYNYIQPVSVSSNAYNYYNYSQPYYSNYNNLTYYNNSSLSPVTYAATNSTQNRATINGYLTVSGTTYNNQVLGTTWFQYGLNQSNLNWSTSPANVYYTTNTNAHLTGLNCGTTYYFRAVTSGQNGIQYGNVLAFTTSQCNYGYQPYPNYNWNNWQPPQIQTYCYKPTKKVVKKRY